MAGACLHGEPHAPGGRHERKWDGSVGQAEQALGRSRGGFGTEIHAAVSGLGLGLTARLIMRTGKEYDGRAVAEAIESRGDEAVVPSLSNRKGQRAYNGDCYRDRNLSERFWHKAKQYWRVATRYEKKAQNFLCFVYVASIMNLLR